MGLERMRIDTSDIYLSISVLLIQTMNVDSDIQIHDLQNVYNFNYMYNNFRIFKIDFFYEFNNNKISNFK